MSKRKTMSKRKAIFAMLISFFIGASIVSCSNDESTDTVEQNPTPAVEQPKEKEQPKDEEIKPEDLPEFNVETKQDDNKLQGAKALLEITAQDVFGKLGIRYNIKVDEENNSILVIQHLSTNDIKTVVAFAPDEWNNLVKTVEDTSWKVSNTISDIYPGITVAVCIGDLDTDKIFLGASNGVVIYNVADELK